jgi:anti-sigma B factor antagonist
MSGPTAKLLVAMDGQRVVIRACGRASFTCSSDFKRLVYQLLDLGCRDYTFELSECTIMDSTFLGILVRFAGKLDEANGGRRKMTLLNPSARILDLISSLGMEDYFDVAEGPASLGASSREVESPVGTPDKAEAARVALEAHEALMQANPDNVARFKDVARFLAEDLKRIAGGG